MSELPHEIETLNDAQICKAALWLIDGLKEEAVKEGDLGDKFDDISPKSLKVFIDDLGEKDIHEVSEEQLTDKDVVTVAKNFLLMLAREDKYSDEVKNAIQASRKTRVVGETIALLSALKTEIGVGIILILSLRSMIRFKIIRTEEGKKRIEFEIEIGKKGLLSDTLKGLFRK